MTPARKLESWAADLERAYAGLQTSAHQNGLSLGSETLERVVREMRDAAHDADRAEVREVDDDRLVTVCDACLTASCWLGAFYCGGARTAGTKDLPIRALKALRRESPDYWRPR
jgi:hypothetical protein